MEKYTLASVPKRAGKAEAMQIAEGIIARMNEQLMSQRDSIGRLLAGMTHHALHETPEGGTVVLFKLDGDSIAALDPYMETGPGGLPYMEVKESIVDSEGRVIITLAAVDA